MKSCKTLFILETTSDIYASSCNLLVSCGNLEGYTYMVIKDTLSSI